ncbi:nucleotide sugar dehydrogenase [Sulfitobacter sp. F26169L]|uniref:nucleotide sugar dehydrogenase n=1 Tax=Sulfitobacter sp. F26169L TaxID=2996015 RepID=UPI002260CE69|nr:nucleotide sugar dehydrogenase [Sulfitobacter sp. F26169L]MCX7568043.1 nucleotide sugar dehydrogenase [Sulfitobacter sp. F26169L]
MTSPASLPALDDLHIGIIGLGYVGLPLAVEFGKKRPTLGFDINEPRVGELRTGIDVTGEVDSENLKSATHLEFSSDLDALAKCNVYIIAVPTPIDSHRQPNLRPLIAASETVGKVLKRGDIVIYESTVYPGATEEDCLPAVERVSGLTFNEDFYAGYSPERINPGDKERPLPKIVKVTSGSTPEVADLVDALYGTIITAGTFKAASIKVAEASKVIENTQRDVNIALINELSIIFSHLDIDTSSVLDAAATKWNFMKLSPGLVGGHCIGVDPYYLVHKSMAVGHIPDIIRHSREINDGMARNATTRLVKKMIAKGQQIKNAKVLMLGFTFKENCPDIRNTKMIDLVENLEGYGMTVDICDSWADIKEVEHEYNRSISNEMPAPQGGYDAVILGVAHKEFVAGGVAPLRAQMKKDAVLFDMKSVFAQEDTDLRL